MGAENSLSGLAPGTSGGRRCSWARERCVALQRQRGRRRM